jgi:hypothetical protein
MAIAFNYSDSGNHIQNLITEVKTLIDIDYDSINIENIDAIRSIAKGIEEPSRSKVFNMLNFIVFNSQVNSVYGDES